MKQTIDRELDIKWEGKKFFVIYSRERKRFEVCKNGVTAAEESAAREMFNAMVAAAFAAQK